MLEVTVRTIETDRAKRYGKLGLRTRAEFVRSAPGGDLLES